MTLMAVTRRSPDPDQDRLIKERFFVAAREQMEVPDPCGILTIAAVADASGIAASTILDQLPERADTTPVRQYQRLVFIELLDRLASAPMEELRRWAITGLSRGEPLAAVAPSLVEMAVAGFVDDPSARYLMAAKARMDADGGIADAVTAAWDRFAVPVADLLELVAAAHGLVLGPGLSSEHLDDVVALTAVTAYLWRHSYPKEALDHEPESAVGMLFMDLFYPMLVPAQGGRDDSAGVRVALDRDSCRTGTRRVGRQATTVERAVSAGADLMMTLEDDEPVLPSGSSLCRRLGIGASTFQRLFGSADNFRREFVLWCHADEFPDMRESVANLFVYGGESTISVDWLVDWGVDFMGRFLSSVPENPPELVFFPWHDHPVVAGCLASEYLDAQQFFLPLANSLLQMVDSEVVAAACGMKPVDGGALEALSCRLVNRVLAVNIAGGFLPDLRANRSWPLGWDGTDRAAAAARGRELLPVRYFTAVLRAHSGPTTG